jgi:hypothetical protein
MSDIAHDLRAFLLEEETIIDVTKEVYRNDIPPEAELPHVRIQRDRANDDLTRDGYGLLTESQFTVDCFGETQQQADDLANAVKTKLETINALASDPPQVGQSVVRAIYVRDKSDDYTPFPEASDIVIPWASMDAEVWHVPN